MEAPTASGGRKGLQKTQVRVNKKARGKKINKTVCGCCHITYQAEGGSHPETSGLHRGKFTTAARCSDNKLHPELESAYSGSSDSGNGWRETCGLGKYSLSTQGTLGTSFQPRNLSGSRSGSTENVGNERDGDMSRSTTIVPNHTLPETQKRGGQTNHQLEAAQSVHRVPTFQNRGHPSPDRHDAATRTTCTR